MVLAGLGFFFANLAAHLKAAGHSDVHFALHGGEPLLLPPSYLRAVLDLQRGHLQAQGISCHNAVQTNLYRVKPETLALCEEEGIAIGVSLDVYGGQRVDAQGRDAEAQVKQNLAKLVAEGLPQRLRMGGISVLHAGNAAQAAETFRFFAELGLDYRILPIFSMVDPPPRMSGLMLTPEQTTLALLDVWQAKLAWRGKPIRVLPIEDYLETAVRQLSGNPTAPYQPEDGEWALIVDTQGDVYNHSEAYSPEYRLGNVFAQDLSDLLHAVPRARLQALRRERIAVCEACVFSHSCTRIPMIEALPSELARNAQGQLRCGVARPLSEHFAAQIQQSPRLHALLAS